MKTITLADRMKEYENTTKYFLQKRLPVIIRLDMRAGHTFTKGLKKPFDKIFQDAMIYTSLLLSKEIQNCKIAYTQSDEISLLLMEETINTDYWFDNNQQKIVSLSASLATLYFNKFLMDVYENNFVGYNVTDTSVYENKIFTATFDSRSFTLPIDEIQNYFIYRQNDCIRNSISMYAQANFDSKDLQKIKKDELKSKLLSIGIDWDKEDSYNKNGVVINQEKIENENLESKRQFIKIWNINKETPNFYEENFINKLLKERELVL